MLVLLNFVSSLLVSFGVGAIYFHLGKLRGGYIHL